jgi:hypothetical protein
LEVEQALRLIRVVLAVLACGLVVLAAPSKAAACLAYGPANDLDDSDYDTPDVAVIGRATHGGPPSDAAFTLTDVIFIRGHVPRPVVYHAEDGWECHAPNFSRGDRILTLRWGEFTTYLGDFSGATWRIDEAGNVLPGRLGTVTINGKTPTTVTEILSHYGIATPDAAAAPPRDSRIPTTVGWLMVAVAAGLALSRWRDRAAL